MITKIIGHIVISSGNMRWRVLAMGLCIAVLLMGQVSCKDNRRARPKKSSIPMVSLGPMEGHVYDAETKKPIQGAQIYVRWSGMGAFSTGYVIDETTAETDAKGHYNIRKVKSEGEKSVWEYELYLYKFGYICFSPEGGYDNVYEPPGLNRTEGGWQRYAIKMDKNEIYLKKWKGWDGRKIRDHLSNCGYLNSMCLSYWSGDEPAAGIHTSVCKEAKNEDTLAIEWFKKSYPQH